MDIKPFYELRNRLYCTASAGCSAVNEDFRLKRAVESFQELANVNKAFGKLYAMCGKLFESDNVSSLLADCIALADALAVTQGIFNVSDETLPYENNTDIKPLNIYYSEYHNIIEMLSNPSKYTNLRTLTGKQLQFIYDPRFLSLFLKKLKEGTNSEYFGEFAYTVCRSYGKSIVPALKNFVDLSNTKANGNIVKYISDICGADENDWYLELALNEEISPSIRENAIKALAYCPENTDTLLELYRTQKGKVKNASIYALAVISPPEAEPIWEKMTKNPEKFAKSNMDYISLSKSRICLEFADKYVSQIAEKLESVTKQESYQVAYDFISACEMFANKPDAEEFIVKVLDFKKNSKNFRNVYDEKTYCAFEVMMIKNVINHPDEPKFRELATNLYEYDKKAFFSSEFFIRLLENPDTAFDFLKDINHEQRNIITDILGNIWYSRSERKYYINVGINRTDSRQNAVPVFEKMPESILKFLTDKSFMESSFTEKALKLLESVGKKKTTVQETISEHCEKITRLLYNLIENENCSPDDSEIIRKYTCEFVFDTVHKYPSSFAIILIGKMFRNEPPEKYRDIFYDYVSYMMNENNHNYRYYVISSSIQYFDNFPLSDDDKLKELIKIEKLAEYIFRENKYPAHQKRELDLIKEYIKKYSAKGNN